MEGFIYTVYKHSIPYGQSFCDRVHSGNSEESATGVDNRAVQYVYCFVSFVSFTPLAVSSFNPTRGDVFFNP